MSVGPVESNEVVVSTGLQNTTDDEAGAVLEAGRAGLISGV